MDATFRHRLLVATPELEDPNFWRSVVVLLEHRTEGAMGVVLNRPTAHDLDEALPGWGDLSAGPAVLFAGGPVGDLTGIALTADRQGAPEIVDLNIDPTTAQIPAGVRIFLGYAGWDPGQLEAEVGSGAWVTADTLPGDILTSRPDLLWRQVLRRQGGRTAWLANVPADLRVN